MVKKIFLLLVLLTLLFNYAGCGKKTDANATPTAVTEGSYSSIAPLDDSRQTAIKVALNQDEELVTMNIKVNVVNYKVTLSGSVETEEQKMRAEELAKSVKGVDKVINNLEVLSKQ